MILRNILIWSCPTVLVFDHLIDLIPTEWFLTIYSFKQLCNLILKQSLMNCIGPYIIKPIGSVIIHKDTGNCEYIRLVIWQNSKCVRGGKWWLILKNWRFFTCESFKWMKNTIFKIQMQVIYTHLYVRVNKDPAVFKIMVCFNRNFSKNLPKRPEILDWVCLSVVWCYIRWATQFNKQIQVKRNVSITMLWRTLMN